MWEQTWLYQRRNMSLVSENIIWSAVIMIIHKILSTRNYFVWLRWSRHKYLDIDLWYNVSLWASYLLTWLCRSMSCRQLFCWKFYDLTLLCLNQSITLKVHSIWIKAQWMHLYLAWLTRLFCKIMASKQLLSTSAGVCFPLCVCLHRPVGGSTQSLYLQGLKMWEIG